MKQPRKSFATWITELSLHRRITILVLFVTILVVGGIAGTGIPLELFPRGYVSQMLYVYVPWNNAPTQEVMEKVTLPLEEELSTVKGLDGVNSWTGVGAAQVFLRFKQGTDMDVAYREVRDRTERAKALFPSDVDRTFIYKDNPSDMPVAFIGVMMDDELGDYYDLVEKEIVLPLSRIDGVAQIEKNGVEQKEILIEVDKDRADAHGLNLYQVSTDLQGDNFSMASGNVRDGERKLLLRSMAKYRTLEELENRRLAPNVRIKDVAEVKYQEPDRRFSVRVNGKPAMALGVKKEGEANTVELCRRLDLELKRIVENPRLSGFGIEMFFNQGTLVENSISNLVGNGRVGGMFAALVLFIFLRRFRLTAIVTLSIPLSLMIALIAIYFYGETLNLLTILGLVICIGLLVDNSVVVAENIHRHFREGMSRKDACVKGASEIALAITMATLTTVIVFLPVSLVEGQAQFFLFRLALPISVSLIASLAVALVFIPLSVYLTLPARTSKPHDGWWFRAHERLNGWLRHFYEAVFGRLDRLYNRVLDWCMRGRRLDLVLVLILMFGATQAVAFKKVKFTEAQEEDQSSFNIGVDLSEEYDFDSTKVYFREAEEIVKEMQDELGLKGFLVMHFNDGGRIEGWMDETREDKPTAKEATKTLAEALPERAGVKLYYNRENRADDAKGPAVFSVNIQGNDSELLRAYGDSIEPTLLKIDGVIGKRLGEDTSPNEMALMLDRPRMNASGVNPEIVAGVIGYALRGQQLTKFHYEGREIPVRVWYQEKFRESLTDLNNFMVPADSGAFLPLATLATPELQKTPQGIFRRDKKVTHTITLELEEEKAEDTRAVLQTLLTSVLDPPEGVTFDNRVFSSRNEDLRNLMFAGLMSIVFIYLLMGFLFESFILPLSIILTIPLASVGVGWMHFVTGKDIDFLGAVGSILLIGVVVNNGIVLIDYINRLRAEGMDRHAAILKAADRRFRPIAMTALTTIIGMVPLTISPPNDMGLSYKSFGLTLIGGMSTATILTLLVVPVFYTFFDDARVAVAKVFASVAGRRERDLPEASSTSAS